MDYDKKLLYADEAVPSALVRVPIEWPFAPNFTSSIYDKTDNGVNCNRCQLHLLGRGMIGQRSGKILVLKMGNHPLRWMNHKFGKRHEVVERRREYYRVIISHEKARNFTSRKKRTSEHNYGTLQEHSLPQVRIN